MNTCTYRIESVSNSSRPDATVLCWIDYEHHTLHVPSWHVEHSRLDELHCRWVEMIMTSYNSISSVVEIPPKLSELRYPGREVIPNVDVSSHSSEQVVKWIRHILRVQNHSFISKYWFGKWLLLHNCMFPSVLQSVALTVGRPHYLGQSFVEFLSLSEGVWGWMIR